MLSTCTWSKMQSMVQVYNCGFVVCKCTAIHCTNSWSTSVHVPTARAPLCMYQQLEHLCACTNSWSTSVHVPLVVLLFLLDLLLELWFNGLQLWLFLSYLSLQQTQLTTWRLLEGRGTVMKLIRSLVCLVEVLDWKFQYWLGDSFSCHNLNSMDPISMIFWFSESLERNL